MNSLKTSAKKTKLLITTVLSLFWMFSKAQGINSDSAKSFIHRHNFYDSAYSNVNKLYLKYSKTSYKNFKLKSEVTIDSRYTGIHFDNSNIPSWITTYKFNNKIEVFGLPFQLTALLGNKMALPSMGIARFQLNFDVNSFTRTLIEKAAEEEKKKLIKEIESDSNYINYKTASSKFNSYRDLKAQRQFNEQLKKQEVMVRQYESTGDSVLMKKPIYLNAKKQLDQYNKLSKEMDSLRKYLLYGRTHSFADSRTQVDIDNYVHRSGALCNPCAHCNRAICNNILHGKKYNKR